MRFSLFAAALLATASPVLAQSAPPFGFEESDIAPDEGFVFGRLDNGLRYVIRHNERPEGTALVRMQVETGSLDETDAERGYAHYVEHMAFNGSTGVPEGEMVKLLEREGLAFGADTNAFTSFDRTQYKLDLPRADADLLDTALMLMRETASNLTFDEEAVAREKGVVLSEYRDGENYERENWRDSVEFLHPESYYRTRLPIGVPETLQAADAAKLRAFYEREYTPEDTWLVVVGDFDPTFVEAEIRKHFADWRAAAPTPRPDEGRIDLARGGQTDVFLHPALSESVLVARNSAWQDEPDSVAKRQRDLLQGVGYGIVNRRLARLARRADPPFPSAGFGVGDVFEIGRTTRLVVNTEDGKWRAGMDAAAEEYARALRFGFTQAEIDEQLARLRTGLQNAVKGAQTRTNGQLAAQAFRLIDEEMIPAPPQQVLAQFEAYRPQVTPDAVLAALREDAAPLDDPLIRFTGRTAPEGGADALRAAWDVAAAREVAAREDDAAMEFAYTDFGPAGEVVSDTVEPALGIRQVRFANNVRLNLKRTEIQQDHVDVTLQIDGGRLLNSREHPQAVALAGSIPYGGLGAHSADELQTILAGRAVQNNFGYGTDYFGGYVHTIPADLGLQLELLAAMVTDPGYRPEGEQAYHRIIDDWFAKLYATPGSALSATTGSVLSDGDPRFSVGPPELYKSLTFAALRDTISDRLAKGAIEIGIVGDIDEDEAIASVARTFGALPERETDFRPYTQERVRGFTADRSRNVVRHTGEANQALVQFVWPTRDDSDPVESIELGLLERVMDIELIDGLREKLGKSYAPGSNSSLSREYPGYGLFTITASVDVADLEETERAIVEIVQALRDRPVDSDVLQRARQPLLESYDNVLKSNPGWVQFVDRAQTEPDRIARYVAAKGRAEAITAQDVEAMAQRYLAPDAAVRFIVLPEDSPAR